MNRLAVFDCDGTLVDSGATICAALGEGFAACGIAAPDERARRGIIGLSVVEAMAVLHPTGDAAAHDRLAEAYRAAFSGLRAAGRAEGRSTRGSSRRSRDWRRGGGCWAWRPANPIAGLRISSRGTGCTRAS